MSAKLPPFTQEGLLPEGEYPMSFDEIRDSWIVKGPVRDHPGWDSSWRKNLVDNFGVLARQLWKVGKDRILIDGSFCEAKDRPRDIDGCFDATLEEMASGRLAAELNKLDPHKVWTWDPRKSIPYGTSGERHLPMWHRYRVDLWPNYPLSGVRDRMGRIVPFDQAFKQTRDGALKGIIRLKK